MAAEVKQVFPEHAQALIAAMQAWSETSQQAAKARQVLDVLLGLLGLPNEEGMQIRAFPDGRLEITHASTLATPQKVLHIPRN